MAEVNWGAQNQAKDWVSKTISEMRGGGQVGGSPSASLVNGLGVQSNPASGNDAAKNWVDKELGQMKGGAGRVNPADLGLDISSLGAKNWLDSQCGGGLNAGGGSTPGGPLGGFGSLLPPGGMPDLGALAGNLGLGSPLEGLGNPLAGLGSPLEGLGVGGSGDAKGSKGKFNPLDPIGLLGGAGLTPPKLGGNLFGGLI